MKPSATAALFTALHRVMKRNRWRWYVFGAQAVIAYGHPRATLDVDATILLDGASGQKLVAEMSRGGFALRVADVESFVATTRVFPFLHQKSGMPLDLVLGGPGLEERIVERARPLDVGKIKIPMISPEDLVVLKILAGRPKDRQDVVGVIDQLGDELDVGYIRTVLAELEEALGQSDLSPAFDELLNRR